jgi:hypothetical protein
MKPETVMINMELFGAHFANLGSGEQAAFFKGMAKELSTWDSNFRKQMQFACIAAELKINERDELENVLTMLYPKEYSLFLPRPPKTLQPSEYPAPSPGCSEAPILPLIYAPTIHRFHLQALPDP